MYVCTFNYEENCGWESMWCRRSTNLKPNFFCMLLLTPFAGDRVHSLCSHKHTSEVWFYLRKCFEMMFCVWQWACSYWANISDWCTMSATQFLENVKISGWSPELKQQWHCLKYNFWKIKEKKRVRSKKDQKLKDLRFLNHWSQTEQ